MSIARSLNSLLIAFIFALTFVSNSYAQQPQATPSPSAPTDDYATQTGFRNKVFEVKHRDASSFLPVLRALGSGFRGSSITASREFKTIAVRDFAENIVTIEQALKRLDVPEAPQTGIELRMHVLVASNTDESTNQYPAELKDVIGQLQSTLNFKNYRLVNSMIQRTRAGATANGSGVAEFGSSAGGNTRTSGTYSYDIRQLTVDTTDSKAPTVQIGLFEFRAEFYVPDIGNYSRASVNTSVSVRDGERVVVGTASLKDRALILVLAARVIK